MIFHFVDMVVVQCLLLYRRDSDMMSVCKQIKFLSLTSNITSLPHYA